MLGQCWGSGRAVLGQCYGSDRLDLLRGEWVFTKGIVTVLSLRPAPSVQAIYDKPAPKNLFETAMARRGCDVYRIPLNAGRGGHGALAELGPSGLAAALKVLP